MHLELSLSAHLDAFQALPSRAPTKSKLPSGIGARAATAVHIEYAGDAQSPPASRIRHHLARDQAPGWRQDDGSVHGDIEGVEPSGKRGRAMGQAIALCTTLPIVFSSPLTEGTMLDYFALGLLIFVGLVLFYGIIVIHDIPCETARQRNHPHQDSIHAAGWVNMFTLHALWPFLWIWATLYREDRGWGFGDGSPQSRVVRLEHQVAELQQRIERL